MSEQVTEPRQEPEGHGGTAGFQSPESARHFDAAGGASDRRLRVKAKEGMIRRLVDPYGVDDRTRLARDSSVRGWPTSGIRGSGPDESR